MEGRDPAGLLLVMVNVTDRSKEAEFNAWYNNVHIPEVTGSGDFGNATRFVNAYAKREGLDVPFLAVYETDREDVAEAWKETGAKRDQWTPSPQYMAPAMATTYKRVGSLSAPPTGKRTTGLLAALTDCPAGREAEFNKWYDGDHVPAITSTPFFWGAARYECTDPSDKRPRFLALYESDTDGAQALRAMQHAHRISGTSMTPFEGLAVRHSGTYDLIHSQARATAKAAA